MARQNYTPLLFSLDIAATVEPLTPEAEVLRREFVEKLQAQDAK